MIAGLSMWSVVDTEEALSGPLDRAEAVYRANLEMRCFRQEVVRVVLLDVQNYWITSVDVFKGTLDESLAHPREIFRPVIVHARPPVLSWCIITPRGSNAVAGGCSAHKTCRERRAYSGGRVLRSRYRGPKKREAAWVFQFSGSRGCCEPL